MATPRCIFFFGVLQAVLLVLVDAGTGSFPHTAMRKANLWQETKARAQSKNWKRRAVLGRLHDTLVLEGYSAGSPEHIEMRLQNGIAFATGQVMKHLPAVKAYLERLKKSNMGYSQGFPSTALDFLATPMDASLSSNAQSTDGSLITPALGNLSTGAYAIAVEVGSPAQQMVPQFDTGSGAFWLACNCEANCNFQPGLSDFKPATSSTAMPLDQQQCDALGSSEPGIWNYTGGSNNATCQFQYSYLDQSSVGGNGISDTVTLINMAGSNITGTVAFGCASQVSPGALSSNFVTGLMGAGPSQDSFLAQLSSQGRLPFVLAVCLAPNNITGSYVIFGRGPSPPSLGSTTMLFVPNSLQTDVQPAYFAMLDQITVAGVPVTSSRGQLIVLDTGASATLLPQPIFTAISNLVAALSGYAFTGDATRGLCLADFTPGFFDENPDAYFAFPEITLAFPNGSLFTVPPNVYFLNSGCLGFVSSNSGLMLVGDTWIAQKYIQFDVANMLISWADVDCASGTYFKPVNGTPPYPTSTTPSPPKSPSPATPPSSSAAPPGSELLPPAQIPNLPPAIESPNAAPPAGTSPVDQSTPSTEAPPSPPPTSGPQGAVPPVISAPSMPPNAAFPGSPPEALFPDSGAPGQGVPPTGAVFPSPSSPSTTPPSSPTATNPPPAAPSLLTPGSGPQISCNKGNSWQQGNETYTQYDCILSNPLPYPVLNITLSCTNFTPTWQWNIQPDCTLTQTTLSPSQSINVGYQTTSGPATISVSSYMAPQGAAIVTPASDSTIQVQLSCNQTGVPYVSNDDFVYQFQCALYNAGTTAVGQIGLSCNNYQPSSSWNIQGTPPNCSTTSNFLGAGQLWSFGFQQSLPNPTFHIVSAPAQ